MCRNIENLNGVKKLFEPLCKKQKKTKSYIYSKKNKKQLPWLPDIHCKKYRDNDSGMFYNVYLINSYNLIYQIYQNLLYNDKILSGEIH